MIIFIALTPYIPSYASDKVNTDYIHNFEYDINKEIGNFEREVIWAYEELGIIPEEEFSKSILEEYLEEKEK